MDSNLLKSAIADAKAVRETALANAKAVLEEAFTPKLQSMLSAKLQQEMTDANIGIDEGPNAYGSADTSVTEMANPNIGVDENPDAYGSSDTSVTEEIEELEEFNTLQGSGLQTQHGKEQVPNQPASNDTLYETEVPASTWGTDKSDMAGSAGQIKASDQDTDQTPNGDTAQIQTQNSPLTPSNTDKSDMRGSAGQIKASDQDKNSTPDNDTSSELRLEGDDCCDDEDKDDKDDEELNEIITELEEELEADSLEGEMDYEVGGDEEVAVDDLGAGLGDEMGGEEVAVDDFGGAGPELAMSGDEVEGEESAGLPVDDVAGDEDVNLDEILREMGLDDAEEQPVDGSELEEMYEQVNTLQKENAEYKKAFGYLRGKLNEVNLLNAKLLYTNKVFKNVALSENQKMKVVEAFDRTMNVREVKLTYTNLRESFKLASAGRKTIREGVASQAIRSTAPSNPAIQRQKQILAEGNEMAARMQKLAGIKKS
jgi:hypothetical protein